MPDRHHVLDRFAPLYPAPKPPPLEALYRRRERKQRNQRIMAGVAGFAVFVAAIWAVTSGGFDSQTPAVPGPAETGPAVTGPAVTGPAYSRPTHTLGPDTEEAIAVGEAFMQAWREGDGEAAAAMFSPEGTFDGFGPAVFPALHDWFRAGGWTFGGGGCWASGGYPEGDVVSCEFGYENDLTRALGMRPVPTGLSFEIEAGRIETAWFGGGGGDLFFNIFGSPDPARQDLFGQVWDMFLEWTATNHPEDFGRMYDPDYGYPVRGYPILDAASIELWERYTHEFVASPEELRRSFTDWMASQSFEIQARRICTTATEEFWAMTRAEELHGREFSAALADVSEEALAELRALPLETEADRATMDEFVPLAERWIEVFREQAATGADVFSERTVLGSSMRVLIEGCLITGLPG
jgi:hypothetical protein